MYNIDDEQFQRFTLERESICFKRDWHYLIAQSFIFYNSSPRLCSLIYHHWVSKSAALFIPILTYQHITNFNHASITYIIEMKGNTVTNNTRAILLVDPPRMSYN